MNGAYLAVTNYASCRKSLVGQYACCQACFLAMTATQFDVMTSTGRGYCVPDQDRVLHTHMIIDTVSNGCHFPFYTRKQSGVFVVYQHWLSNIVLALSAKFALYCHDCLRHCMIELFGMGTVFAIFKYYYVTVESA